MELRSADEGLSYLLIKTTQSMAVPINGMKTKKITKRISFPCSIM